MNVARVIEQVKSIHNLTIDLAAILSAMEELENPDNLVPPGLFMVRELEQRLDLLAEQFGGWARMGLIRAPKSPIDT